MNIHYLQMEANAMLEARNHLPIDARLDHPLSARLPHELPPGSASRSVAQLYNLSQSRLKGG